MMKVPNDYYDKWNICDTDEILIYGCNKHYEIDMCYSTKYAALKRKCSLVGSESE
jgi:hypothetical protein